MFKYASNVQKCIVTLMLTPVNCCAAQGNLGRAGYMQSTNGKWPYRCEGQTGWNQTVLWNCSAAPRTKPIAHACHYSRDAATTRARALGSSPGTWCPRRQSLPARARRRMQSAQPGDSMRCRGGACQNLMFLKSALLQIPAPGRTRLPTLPSRCRWPPSCQ